MSGIGVHSNKFNTTDLFTDHPGNGIAAGTTHADYFNFGSAWNITGF
jgi:hypothetical protein